MGSVVTVLPVQASEPDASELRNLVVQDCGSCHGLRLGGGLGPALRPEELERLSVEAIATIIRHGTPDTAMPPWKDLLSEHEIRWISEKLKSGALLNNDDPR
ncbi:cytochrome C [Halovibrio salipaludis]|uniref:Cytochrome C n=1 Tax=Halovibrio salipaludis TaxID=2032626 RepID=A0A2A2FCL0_9GAMM|nr:cytochrome c [Halovibrio salipaludis]PAU82474.1 cytochrome C [Halovibrio salipaludis]